MNLDNLATALALETFFVVSMLGYLEEHPNDGLGVDIDGETTRADFLRAHNMGWDRLERFLKRGIVPRGSPRTYAEYTCALATLTATTLIDGGRWFAGKAST